MSKQITIGKRIEQLLDERDIKRKELMEYLDCSESTVHNYISDKRMPSLETVVKIAKFFNITIESLIGVDEPTVEDISIEETIRRLDILKETSIFEGDSYMDQAIRKALDVLDGLTWKDPKKELPEANKVVLVKLGDHGYELASLSSDRKCWFGIDDTPYENSAILKWMYIPKEV